MFQIQLTEAQLVAVMTALRTPEFVAVEMLVNSIAQQALAQKKEQVEQLGQDDNQE